MRISDWSSDVCSSVLEQVQATLRDLRAHDVEMVTIGQYLQPSAHHHPVLRYWTPDEFKALEVYGMSLGFTHVASGPLVRSSYHAEDRKSVVKGTSVSVRVDLGGRRWITKTYLVTN